jgi:hypothetical protein
MLMVQSVFLLLIELQQLCMSLSFGHCVSIGDQAIACFWVGGAKVWGVEVRVCFFPNNLCCTE